MLLHVPLAHGPDHLDWGLAVVGEPVVDAGEFGQGHGGVEHAGVRVVAVLLVVQDVAEEYDLELVHVELFGDLQHHSIGIAPQQGYLMQDLIRLVAQARSQVLIPELLIWSQAGEVMPVVDSLC